MNCSSVAVYVHFPWCLHRCAYCDFDTRARGFELIPPYVETLAREVTLDPPEQVHSVYFGGGTPSLMTPAQVRRVLEAMRAHFTLLPDAEVTLECNPGDLDAAKVAGYLEAGVNRLSIGVQALDDGTLRRIDRRHDAATARAAVRAAREGGCANLNLDLMYGLPGTTPEAWRRTLEEALALALAPDHLSAYLLTLDERTPMGAAWRAGQLELPDEEAVVEMYADLRRLAAAAGLAQYEISNWARPGRACRHNLTYWRNGTWLAIGAGAAGHRHGLRWKNTPSVRRHMVAVAQGRREYVEHEQADPWTAAEDTLVLGLRLREGVELAEFARRTGFALDAGLLGATVEELRALGLLERAGGRLRLTETALLVSNEAFLRLTATFATLRQRGEGPVSPPMLTAATASGA